MYGEFMEGLEVTTELVREECRGVVIYYILKIYANLKYMWLLKYLGTTHVFILV